MANFKKSPVAVAVSGGVDSLCSLLLLKNSGHQVLAVHGIFQETPESQINALENACHKLGVKLHVADMSSIFRREVIEPFAHEYGRGHTPNPCALCNRAIKFGALRSVARKLGANHLATGHYAHLVRRKYGADILLGPAKDKKKDQSYFLGLVPSNILNEVIFPLGELEKAECRQLVASAGVTVPVRQESQDICFAGKAHADFLEMEGLLPMTAGPIYICEKPDAKPKLAGTHKGLWRYTEGQRKGLGLPFSEPLYVIRLDSAGNRLFVGPRSMLGQTGFLVKNPNFFVAPDKFPENILCRMRYGQDLQPCVMEYEKGIMSVRLLTPAYPSAVGQIAALYDGEGIMLAAGIISKVRHTCPIMMN